MIKENFVLISPKCRMPVNNSDERHDNEENELSSSDVPVYHMMDEVNEDEYDFANDNSDEESENNYELLSQDGDEHVNYYSHHMIVNWVDEQSDSEQQHSNIQVNHSEAISNQSQEDNQVTHKSNDDFSMSEGI